MIGAILPMPPGVTLTPGPPMVAPAARPTLFRFDRPAPPAAAAPVEPAATAPPRPIDERAVAAWRGPVLACGVAVVATAGLAFSALAPEAGRRRAKPPAPPTAGGVILASAAEETAEAIPPVEEVPATAPVTIDAVPAPPVVPALHVWDGRPIRAVPTDTLPNEFGAPGGPVRADGVTTAGGEFAEAPRAGVVSPAVWLTGEIVD